MRCKYYADTANPKRSYLEWVISVNFVMSAKVNDTDVAARGRHQGGPQNQAHLCLAIQQFFISGARWLHIRSLLCATANTPPGAHSDWRQRHFLRLVSADAPAAAVHLSPDQRRH